MSQIEDLVRHIRKELGDLNMFHADAEYQYSSLALCVIDSVFSLGVRYESTERTVREWCQRFAWQMAKGMTRERTIMEFLEILRPYENRWEAMANQVFHNRQRTSARSGILKAEAVFYFAETLQQFGIETFADALKSGLSPRLRQRIAGIPGQGSGLSYNYFLILAGNANGVKADRMVTRFVADALRTRNVSSEDCERLVREAAAILRSQFPALTPSLLDHAIWRYQRQFESGSASCRPAAAGK